jgi:vacuolar-type H+-ATPase subunit I/STV1
MSNSVFFILVSFIALAVCVALLFGPALFFIFRTRSAIGRKKLIALVLVCELLAVVSLIFQAQWAGLGNPAGVLFLIIIMVGALGAWIIRNVSFTRTEIPIWLAVLAGYLFAELGLLVLVPILVDFLIQIVFSIPEGARRTPMLSIDLFLSTIYLTGTLFLAGWWSIRPKLYAPLLIALIEFVLTIYMRFSQGLYKPGVMPIWYETSILLSIVLSYGIAHKLLVKLDKQ